MRRKHYFLAAFLGVMASVSTPLFADDYAAAQAAEAKGDYTTAVQYFTKVIQARPDAFIVYQDRGVAYARLGDYEHAMTDFKTALKSAKHSLGDKDPRLAQIFYNMGVTFQAERKSKEAIDNYEKAIWLDPNYPGAHGNLAWVLATAADPRLHDPDTAIAAAQSEQRLNASAAGLDTIAAAYASAGKFVEAQMNEQKAMDLETDPQARSNYLKRMLMYKRQLPYTEDN